MYSELTFEDYVEAVLEDREEEFSKLLNLRLNTGYFLRVLFERERRN